MMSHNVQRVPPRRHCLPAGPPAEPRTAAKVVRQGAVYTGARRRRAEAALALLCADAAEPLNQSRPSRASDKAHVATLSQPEDAV
jgi:hypothetical protein